MELFIYPQNAGAKLWIVPESNRPCRPKNTKPKESERRRRKEMSMTSTTVVEVTRKQYGQWLRLFRRFRWKRFANPLALLGLGGSCMTGVSHPAPWPTSRRSRAAREGQSPSEKRTWFEFESVEPWQRFFPNQRDFVAANSPKSSIAMARFITHDDPTDLTRSSPKIDGFGPQLRPNYQQKEHARLLKRALRGICDSYSPSEQ